MRQATRTSWLVGLLALAGCGGGAGDGLVPVAGVVSLDGQPLAHATVSFAPQGATGGHGGSGRTDSSGRYQVTTPYGKKGLEEGAYKVAISRRLNPDGTPPPPDEKPIESNAKEHLAPRYSDPARTQLTANVSASSPTTNFDLQSKKK